VDDDREAERKPRAIRDRSPMLAAWRQNEPVIPELPIIRASWEGEQRATHLELSSTSSTPMSQGRCRCARLRHRTRVGAAARRLDVARRPRPSPSQRRGGGGLVAPWPAIVIAGRAFSLGSQLAALASVTSVSAPPHTSGGTSPLLGPAAPDGSRLTLRRRDPKARAPEDPGARPIPQARGRRRRRRPPRGRSSGDSRSPIPCATRNGAFDAFMLREPSGTVVKVLSHSSA
jgi:hypothetical protein